MPTFVHLTTEDTARQVRTRGLRAGRLWPSAQGRGQGADRGVFAMPVLPDFQVSHQWLRELRRRGPRQLVGVYFRIPDAEPVLVGRFNQDHAALTASQAVALLLNGSDILGFEVIIPRSIPARAITAVRGLRQLTGWRYYPGANGKPPFCRCPYCQRGEINCQRLRRQYQA